METLWQDIRYGFRSLVRTPAFTFVAVVALALGIGANTAIFSVVYGVLLKPLPYKDADRLAVAGLSYPDYRDLKESTQVFDQTAVWASNLYSFTTDGEARQVLGGVVTPEFFSMLGSPMIGKAFAPDEDTQPLAVLSYDLWQNRFGGTENAIGQTMELGGKTYTIVGVMPPEFQFPDSRFKLWVTFGSAMGQAPKQLENRQLRIFRCLAHLKPGVSPEQAQAEVDALALRLQQDHPTTNAGVGITFTRVYERIVGNVRPALLILLYTVGFVLLIACANVANLQLSRTVGRGREIAIRTALGASRWRIVRQLITESLVLALAGGALGVLIAIWLVDALPSFSPSDIPRLSTISINLTVLLFTFGVSILTGVLFGVVPALGASKFNLNETLKEGGRSASGNALGRRLRSGLVIAEIALSLVVLIGAGLLIKSFANVIKSDSGFKADNLMTMTLELFRIKDEGQRTSILNQIIARVGEVPGVEAVGGSTGVPPATPQRGTQYVVEGQEAPVEEPETAYFIAVTADAFNALGTPLVAGRWFTERDDENSQKVIIINQRVARRLFPDTNPIGKRLKLMNPEYSEDWREIVGVVGDVKYQGLDDTALTSVYTPFAQTPFLWSYLLVKSSTDPATVAAGVRAAVASVDPHITAVNVQQMSAVVSESVAQRRFNMLLLAGFAGLALVLAAVGLYGVMSYLVTQRTREIGVRMALGARGADVVMMVVGQAMTLTIIGVVVGIAGAIAATRLLNSMLFNVQAIDPLTYGLISLMLIVVALLASLLPARRATRVDPIIALRYE